MRGPAVKAENVRSAKELKARNANLTQAEMGAILGYDRTTVGKILRGDYDYLLADPQDGGGAPDFSELLASLDLCHELLGELKSLCIMNNELLRICALGITNQNDPTFSKSKQIAASMRQSVIEATYNKTRADK